MDKLNIGQEVLIINKFKGPFFIEGRAKIIKKMKEKNYYQVQFENGKSAKRYIDPLSQIDPFDFCANLNNSTDKNGIRQ